jgi:phage terminase large subunit
VVDVIGIGAGVVDRLRELGLPIRGVNVSESPAVQDKYMRLRDELWWRARAWFEARDSQLPKGCDMLVGELASPRYVIASNGKIKVESKDEMKKRAIRSPDEGDAFCLTFASQGSPKAYMKPLVYKIPTKAFV